MYEYILFGIYITIIFGIFGFFVIFFIHIRDFREYSKYLTSVFRLLIVSILLIAIFGGYKILTSKNSFSQFLHNSPESSSKKIYY